MLGAGGRASTARRASSAQRSSASAALAARTETARSGLGTANSWKRGIAANSSPGGRGDFRGGRAGASGRRRALEGADLPGAVLPDERDDLGPPRLLRLDGGAAADDADVPDRDGRLLAENRSIR